MYLVIPHILTTINTVAVAGLLEAVWDWIVSMENWQEVSPRDPVIKEARDDLERQFKVFRS